MRGHGQHGGLGGARSDWKLPDLPKRGSSNPTSTPSLESPSPPAASPSPPTPSPNPEQLKRKMESKGPPRPSPALTPAPAPAVKPPPGFWGVRSPEDERPPIEPPIRPSLPSPFGQPQAISLNHEDQVPIGGHDLVSVPPSLAESSVSQLSQSADDTPYSYLPKSELHSLYGQRGKLLSAKYYHTWHDGGPAHSLRWTSALLCPITSELYLSVPYGAAKDVRHGVDGLFWFMKKSHAEHAAAAIAYDCCMLRLNVFAPTRLSMATAYEAKDKPSRFDLPASAPATIRLAVEEQQAEWRRQAKREMASMGL